MKKVFKSNKKGFTLVEMMLSIAIIVLMSSLFVSLMLAINNSFYTTYNTNDAVDYAAIYSQALENVVIRDVQNNYAAAKITYSIDYASHCEFYRDVEGGAKTTLFNLRQLQNGSDDKWKIYIEKFEEDATAPSTYNYSIVLVDNYYHPGRFQMRYTGSFWVPHMSKGTITADSTGKTPVTVYNSDNQPMFTFTPVDVVFEV